MAPPLVMAAAGATAASGIIGFKASQAQAKALRQLADYEAQVAEQEAVLLARKKADQEAQLRQQGEDVASQQRVATASAGITMSGSPLLALAETYFGIEEDALRIQYASDIEQTQKKQEAILARAEGRAKSSAAKTQGYQSLLESGSRAATLLG